MTIKEQTLITPCDEIFFDKVEENLRDICSFQSLTYQHSILLGPLKWLHKFRKPQDSSWQKLRLFFLIACCLCVLLIIGFMVVNQPTPLFWCLLIIYTIFVMIFWHFKQPPFYKLGLSITNKSSQHSSAKMLKKARTHLPYLAQYKFWERSVSYHRIKDDSNALVWERSLPPFAIIHNHAALFFKSANGIVPQVLILYEDVDDFMSILEGVEQDFIFYSQKQHDQLIKELS